MQKHLSVILKGKDTLICKLITNIAFIYYWHVVQVPPQDSGNLLRTASEQPVTALI